MRRILVLLAGVSSALAQTTQGLITGRVLDSLTGRPVRAAEVAARNLALNFTVVARTAESGAYALPFLSPGVYRLRIAATGYQPQEVHELVLAVAARLELTLHLRPLTDVWEAGQHRSVFLPQSEGVLTFYGPDVDTSRSGAFEATRGTRGALESTVSEVIDPAQVRELPLAGRDVYTMLVAQPGVTADAGTTRGLGLSVNGQRPSASNFMLDGLENNHYLVTGPLAALAPEAVQEYRVSTTSFSAEYGRTAGYLANAVTRAGGAQWHGIVYWNLKNDALNAGEPKTPLKEAQAGFHAGGPLRRQALFVSSALERLRSRSRAESAEVLLPSTEFPRYTAPDSLSRRLIQRYSPPPVTKGILPVAALRLAPPVSVDRYFVLERLDYLRGRQRVMGRFAAAGLSRPDFIWTPYKDFVSGLEQDTYSFALAHVTTLRPHLGNEIRFGWSADTLGWDRARPDFPTLGSLDGTVLPGSPAFYAFRNRGRGVEFVENLLWTSDRHVVKLGGGLLTRRLDGYLTAGRDGRYLFADFLDFAVDEPLFFAAALDRRRLPSFHLHAYDREYRFNQFHWFAQDTFKIAERLVVNFGLRYENFGAPRNTSAAKDGVVDLERAEVRFPDRPLHDSSGGWAPRFGFSYGSKVLVRGAYGLFFDRPFDNLWQNLRNNSFVLPNFIAQAGNYLAPLSEVLARYQGQRFAGDFPLLTMLDHKLSSGYAQSFFLGLQHQPTESWAVELNGLGALGRRLITTDQINRRDGRHAPELPVLSYRAAEGLSDYYALTARARYRSARAQFQVAYTWSHSIDLQSEPLAGDFFDLSFVRVGAAEGRGAVAAFSGQRNSRADRASSDFDQRHNLVFYSIWDLPRMFRGWRFSQLAAFRTGFPFTVYAPSTLTIFNNRADLVGPAKADEPASGGRRILNRAAFRAPPAGRIGNTGRNAFRGPGLYNVDLSLARAFTLRRLGEAGRLTVRADVYNVFNHANLNNPDSFLGSETFGVALYGRRGRDTGFPALAPFRETPRQLQLMLRLEF